jgi:hypothetical protein
MLSRHAYYRCISVGMASKSLAALSLLKRVAVD